MTANSLALNICRQCGEHSRDRTLGEQRCLPGAPRVAFCLATASCRTPSSSAGSRDDRALSGVDSVQSSVSMVEGTAVNATGLAADGASVSPAAEQLGSRPSSPVDMTDTDGPVAAVAWPPPAADDTILRWLSWCLNGDLFLHECGRLCLCEVAWDCPAVSPNLLWTEKFNTRSRLICAASSCESRRVNRFVDKTLGLPSTVEVVLDLGSAAVIASSSSTSSSSSASVMGQQACRQMLMSTVLLAMHRTVKRAASLRRPGSESRHAASSRPRCRRAAVDTPLSTSAWQVWQNTRQFVSVAF